ncbi:hypothetical protein F511_00929 [Dorcoceras hygrometricum]|nr:hypothetical protein F511_00929 [Dorcoceras hygrometricum]
MAFFPGGSGTMVYVWLASKAAISAAIASRQFGSVASSLYIFGSVDWDIAVRNDE